MRLFVCYAIALLPVLSQFGHAEGDPIDRMLTSIDRNRFARFVFAYEALTSASISSPEDKPQEHFTPLQVLKRANHNISLGVVLRAPIENYIGGRDDRHYTATGASGSLECTTSTSFGALSISWDQSADIYPKGLTVRIEANDVYDGTPLKEIQLSGKGGWPAGGLLSVTSEISDIVTKEYSSHVVPVEWNCVDSYVCTDGTLVVEQCHIKVIDLDLHPDPSEARKVGVEIPIGRPVTVQDAEHLAYVWGGDWAAPQFQLLRTSAARPSNRYFTVISAIVLPVVIAIALLIWCQRRRHST